jgi:hypothetical protein
MTDDTTFTTPPPPKPSRLISMKMETKPRSEVEKAGDHIRKDFDAICENATTIAQLRRAMYLAYIKEGFSAEEALALCCK